MKQAVSILCAATFFPVIFLGSGVFLWAERSPMYESVIVETFDGLGSSKYPEGSTAKILHEDGSTETTNISGEDVIWRASNPWNSRYTTEGFPVAKYVNSWPVDLFGTRPEDADQKQIYGVRVKFDRQGHNYFAVYTGTEINGEWQPQGLPLSSSITPGRIENISIWVWGANYDYTIELHVRDFRGIPYTLPMFVVSGTEPEKHKIGSLLFSGWRKMAAEVPDYIPQDGVHGLQDYRLKFIKYVVRTSPYERVDDFHIYFDQMQIVLDKYSSFYDGRELATPERIREIWEDGAKGNEEAQ